MIFSQTIDDLLLKASPTQAQELQALQEVQVPNAIQLEIVNKIRLAQIQEIKHQELLKQASQKILKSLEKITHKVQEYPLDRLETLNQIISSQEISESQESIIQILEFLFPEHKDWIISLFENLEETKNLDPNQIQILDFTPLSQSNFQVSTPTNTVQANQNSNPNPTPLDQINSIESFLKTKLESLKDLAKEHKWFLLIMASIISYRIYSYKTQKCISINAEGLSQSSITSLLNNHSISSKEYIESFQPNSNHLKLHLNLKYIYRKINDDLNIMNQISNYPLKVNVNLIDQITGEVVYTAQPSYSTPTKKQMEIIQKIQKLYLYQVEVNAIGFSFRSSSRSAFIPTDISIINPITQDNFQEQYLIEKTKTTQK